MMRNNEFFYGPSTPEWTVDTAAAPIRYLPPSYYSRPMAPQKMYAPEPVPVVVPVQPAGPQTTVLRVPICCEGCEERVTKALLKVDGVYSVRCYADQKRVVVTGFAAPTEILRVSRKAFKRSSMWSSKD